MPINLVSHSIQPYTSADNNSSITGVLPAGGANGNLLTAFLISNNVLNPSNYAHPSGWNHIVSNFNTNGNFNTHIAIAWRIRTGTENLTWTIGADPRDDQIIIAEWSGDFNPVDPVSAFAIAAGATATSFTSPSLSAANDNSVLVCGCAAKNGTGSEGIYPASMTGIVNSRSRSNSFAVRSALARQVVPVGSTGTRAWDSFLSSAQYGNAFSLVINHTDAPPAITSVNGGTDTARIGQSVSVAVSNFTDPVNAGTIDTVPLAAASSTSITLPSFAPGALVPRVGASRALVLTRGAQSATRNIAVQAPYVPDVLVEGNPVAYEYVTAEAGFNTGANDSVVFGFDPPMAAGRQIFYDPTKGYVTPQMQYVGDYIGEQIMWDYDPDTRIIRQFTVITNQEDTGIRVKLKRPLKRSLKRRL